MPICDDFQCAAIDSTRELLDDELTILFDAQREIIEAGGVLGLYGDLSFVTCRGGVSGRVEGILAVRPHDDGAPWIQMAFVYGRSRRRGIFRQMVRYLIERCPGKRIGLATSLGNTAMQSAAASLGFTQEVLYFYRDRRESERWNGP